MSQYYEIGERVRVRLGWWSDYRAVHGYIRHKFLCFYLVEWGVQESWDGTPPFDTYTVTRWKFPWQIYPTNSNRKE